MAELLAANERALKEIKQEVRQAKRDLRASDLKARGDGRGERPSGRPHDPRPDWGPEGEGKEGEGKEGEGKEGEWARGPARAPTRGPSERPPSARAPPSVSELLSQRRGHSPRPGPGPGFEPGFEPGSSAPDPEARPSKTGVTRPMLGADRSGPRSPRPVAGDSVTVHSPRQAAMILEMLAD